MRRGLRLRFGRRRRARRPATRGARWVARLVPLVFIGVGLYFLQDAYRFTGRALEAEGEVASVAVARTRDNETGEIKVSYRPSIRFTSADGGRHVSPTHIRSSNYDYAVGDRVAILYDPADPSQVRINSVWSLWLMPVAFTALGALFLVIFTVFDRRKRRAETIAPAPPAPAPDPAPETASETAPAPAAEPAPDRPPRRTGRYEDRPPTVRR